MKNLIGSELAYINTHHPDFDEARLIYRALSDDNVDASDLHKVSAHNAMTHDGTTGKQDCVVRVLQFHSFYLPLLSWYLVRFSVVAIVQFVFLFLLLFVHVKMQSSSRAIRSLGQR